MGGKGQEAKKQKISYPLFHVIVSNNISSFLYLLTNRSRKIIANFLITPDRGMKDLL